VVALVLVVALGLAATSLFWQIVSPTWRALSSTPARIGDCLSFDPAGARYVATDCSAVAADYRLVGIGLDRAQCVDVPGATRTYDDGRRVWCIGEKGVDPVTALNGIAAGDCVGLEAGRPVRDACEGGTLPVLAVVRDVPRAAGESRDGLFGLCTRAEAAETRQTYGWGLAAADGSEPATWDRVLCLGAPGS
jgi:hypothetical protein